MAMAATGRNEAQRSVRICSRLRRFVLAGLAGWIGWVSGVGASARAESPFAPLLAGPAETNRVALLSGGDDALLLRVHLIRQARRSIEVQTFIWTNDEVGRLVMWELLAAARRGVQVRIIADQPFSEKDPELVAFLATAHPNLQIKHYRPTLARIRPTLAHTLAAGLRSFKGVNQRMHSKVMLFDGAVLITGGRNIENAYFDHATELNYRDRDVVVAGPAAREAARMFEAFWNFKYAVASRDLVDVEAAIARGGAGVTRRARIMILVAASRR